jgi:hypothetical protein
VPPAGESVGAPGDPRPHHRFAVVVKGGKGFERVASLGRVDVPILAFQVASNLQRSPHARLLYNFSNSTALRQ